MKKAVILLLVLAVSLLVPVSATSPVIQIQVAKEVVAGTEVTVDITVTHRMNDKNHHISYIWLYQDDGIVQEWVYTPDDFVKEDQWTVTYKTVLIKDAVFLAVANCTLHGTAKVTAKVTVLPFVEKPKAILLANAIDFSRASTLVTFLEDHGFEVVHISAAELSAYKTQKLIIILGGVDAPDGVGEVVKSVLSEREQELTRVGVQYFRKDNVWASGQKIFVFAGKNREQTMEAHQKHRDKILE